MSKLWLKVPTWATTYYALSDTDLDNEAALRVAFAAGAICGTDLKPPKVFAPMSRGYLLDADGSLVEEIAQEVVAFSGGPVSMVPVHCRQEGCGGSTPIPFLWHASGVF